MKIHHGPYEIDDDRTRVDLDLVHSWLTTSYWQPNCTRESVQRAFENTAIVVGVFHEGSQVGYMRIVSDLARFAWVCDVWITDEHRGRGLGTALAHYAVDHPELATVRQIVLATKDAHSVYEKAGFGPFGEEANRFMRVVRGKSACDPSED